jgi:hypothetical protein
MKKWLVALLMLGFLQGAHSSTLDAAEIEDLRFMVEEEKLAHDVYLTFQRKYRDRVFPSIRRSEQQHIDAVVGLLDRYGVENPSKPGVGKFDNQTLQSLYDSLIARGMKDRIEAIKVGALIEETDLRDLTAAIERSDEWAIDRVYANLRAGSTNHLQAFVNRLQRLGVTYEPTVLSQEEYLRIVGD